MKNKGCTNIKPQEEELQILSFANANRITAIKHSSGLYYEITNPGSGATPTINSKVSVTYTGKLLNGTLFDEASSPKYFYLAQVIEGWQLGLPLIRKGGNIKLIIPSSLAYGCNGYSTIPSNSVLLFEVNLVDVQ
jgi:FKBP-type peptidyl-prolyl cis-trans isomerase